MRESDKHYRRGEHPKNLPPEEQDELPSLEQVLLAISDRKKRDSNQKSGHEEKEATQ